MDELRVIRREDNALILANDLGDEFRFVVDEVAASEFRQLARRPMSAQTVRPREIQSLLRAGKTRAEVAKETGADEADVERFEGPVRAEQTYILELAHAVPVRTDPHHESSTSTDDQQFGAVIAERLSSLGSIAHEWRSWRDAESGWLVGLLFHTRDAEHDAVWRFDHRKHVLTPSSPDATHLSKAGDVGDQLIPKLRAVDLGQGTERTSDPLATPSGDVDLEEAPDSSEDAATTPVHLAPPEADDDLSPDAEYERRREIDQRAVKTPVGDPDDLNQTADLLDALRKRRGERAAQLQRVTDEPDKSGEPNNSASGPGLSLASDVLGTDLKGSGAGAADGSAAPPKRPSAATNIWGAAGVSADEPPTPSRAVPVDEEIANGNWPAPLPGLAPSELESGNAGSAKAGAQEAAEESESAGQAKPSKRGRSSIPSWDDILFGTRSDDDPA